MDKINICVFFTKDDNNTLSIESASYILNKLNSDKYTKIPIFIDSHGKWFLYDGPIYDILNNDINKIGTSTVLSPCSSHNGLLRIVNDKNRIIPIDKAISVVYDLEKETMIRSMLSNANISFIGQNAIDFLKINDDKLKFMMFEKYGIDTVEYEIFNKNFDDEKTIIDTVKEELSFPVIVSKLNCVNKTAIYECSDEKELIKKMNEIFEDSDEIIVKSIKGLIKIDEMFCEYNSEMTGYTSIIQADEQVLVDSISLVCSELVEIFNIFDLFVVTFYCDKESGKVLISDINTNLLLTKDSFIKECFEIYDLSFREFIESLIESEF